MGGRENECQISQNYILHMKFSELYLCNHNSCEIGHSFSRTSRRNFLFHLKPLKNVKKNAAFFNWIILVQGFCPLKIKFTQFPWETVDHEILLTKMNRCGIQGKTLDWFKSFLTNRTQRCSVKGCLSDLTTLKCGVSQGMILGPLLFLIYINDLPNCLSFRIPRMYADDTHITYAGSDLHLIQSSLSHDLEKLSKWLV